jgi:hypothetical protein
VHCLIEPKSVPDAHPELQLLGCLAAVAQLAVRAASTEQLDEWLDRILEASGFDDLLDLPDR